MLEIAVMWFINKDREILLQKRSLTKSMHPGEWGPSVTGTAEIGEQPEETLLREVEEEIGLTPIEYKPEFIMTKDFMHPDGRIRRFSIFYALVPKEIVDKFKLDEKEVAEVRWLPIKKVRELMATPSPEFKIVASSKEVWPETFEILEKNFNAK